MDSADNNALKSESLKNDKTIYISWTVDRQANRYKVNIFKGDEFFYYQYCDTGYCYLEPKTLQNGDEYIQLILDYDFKY